MSNIEQDQTVNSSELLMEIVSHRIIESDGNDAIFWINETEEIQCYLAGCKTHKAICEIIAQVVGLYSKTGKVVSAIAQGSSGELFLKTNATQKQLDANFTRLATKYRGL